MKSSHSGMTTFLIVILILYYFFSISNRHTDQLQEQAWLLLVHTLKVFVFNSIQIRSTIQ